MGPWTRIRELLEPAQTRAIQGILDDMDEMRKAGERAITSCRDCGSQRMATHWPDGTVSTIAVAATSGDPEEADGTARRAPVLTTGETLAMIRLMAERATETARDEPVNESFWEGWAGGLKTLAKHIQTGVKATCFPVGSCPCHPLPPSRSAS